ncbi:pilus assembly protein PilP [Motiliproteus sp. SC1-56]|uniref:pilus assembly protein PilP n=1 Tax=Motiliproteus sp. SC1-56 TaxID=2799565 RepID=UPI001A8EEE41|nr:pilus assembly protein PilP [Motiliproteus sp. SC1-56]
MTTPSKQRRPLARAAITALGLMLLQACSQVNDLSDLQQYVRETQAKPSGRIDPLPKFEPYESFLYRATSLRGPFQELVRIEPSDEEEFVKNDLKPDFERPKEPLEAFKLENLRMVGTIHMLENGDLTALIRDANGEIHRVRSGNYLGRNFGEITQVDETQLDILEIVPNGRDGWMKRPRNLVLVENQ